MQVTLTRRDAFKLAAIGGGVVFASRLIPKALAIEEFFFVQLSDTHWGFEDPSVNPDPRASLEDAVKAAKTDRAPIRLLVKEFDRFRTIAIDYHDGLRYPRLQRIKARWDPRDVFRHALSVRAG